MVAEIAKPKRALFPAPASERPWIAVQAFPRLLRLDDGGRCRSAGQRPCLQLPAGTTPQQRERQAYFKFHR